MGDQRRERRVKLPQVRFAILICKARNHGLCTVPRFCERACCFGCAPPAPVPDGLFEHRPLIHRGRPAFLAPGRPSTRSGVRERIVYALRHAAARSWRNGLPCRSEFHRRRTKCSRTNREHRLGIPPRFRWLDGVPATPARDSASRVVRVPPQRWYGRERARREQDTPRTSGSLTTSPSKLPHGHALPSQLNMP